MINTALLKAKIVEKETTQRKLAKQMGMGENTLGNKINNRAQFSVCEVVKLCDLLGIKDAKIKDQIFLCNTSQK